MDRRKPTFGKKMFGWKIRFPWQPEPKLEHVKPKRDSNGRRRWVNDLCYNLIKWWDAICLGKNTIGKSVKRKR